MVRWSKSRRWFFATQLDKLVRLNEIRAESPGEVRAVDPLLHVKEPETPSANTADPGTSSQHDVRKFHKRCAPKTKNVRFLFA